MNNEGPELDENPIIYGNHDRLAWDDIPLDGSRFYITEREVEADGTIRGHDSIGYVIAHDEDSITVEFDYTRRYYKAPDGPEHYDDWEYAAEGEPSGNSFELMDLPRITIEREELESTIVGRTYFIGIYAHDYKQEEEAEVEVANNMNMPFMEALIASAPDPNILLRRTNGPGLTVSVARSRRQRRHRRTAHQSRMRRRPGTRRRGQQTRRRRRA